MTRLEVHRDVANGQVILSDPSLWLPPPARPSGHDRWTSTLRVGPLHRDVQILVGGPIRNGAVVARTLRWDAGRHPGDLLPFEILIPPFSGDIVAHGDQLRVAGTYTPPASWLGALVDVVLRSAAARTLHAFLEDVAAASSPNLSRRDSA